MSRHLHRFSRPDPKNRPTSLSELAILQQHHQFIRDESSDGAAIGNGSRLTWEDKLALSWYNKLFREYAVCDLSQYKTGGIALRWRTEEEVLERIGELTCGSLTCRHHTPVYVARSPRINARGEEEEDTRPLVKRHLEPYQLNFAYVEQGVHKQALVKVVLCDRCKGKLTYKKDQERAAKALASETQAATSASIADTDAVRPRGGLQQDRDSQRSDKSRRREASPERREAKEQERKYRLERGGSKEPRHKSDSYR